MFSRFILFVCVAFFSLVGFVGAQQTAMPKYVVKVVGCGTKPLVIIQFPVSVVDPKEDRVITVDGEQAWSCASKLCKQMTERLAKVAEVERLKLRPENSYQVEFELNRVLSTDREVGIQKVVAAVVEVLRDRGKPKLPKNQTLAEDYSKRQNPDCPSPRPREVATPTPTPTPMPTPTPSPAPTTVGPFTEELFYDSATDTGSEGSQVVLLLNAMRRLPGGVLTISNGCWKQRFGPNVQAGLLRWQSSLAAHGVRATGRVDAPMRAYLNKLYQSRPDLFAYLPWPPCQPAKVPPKRKPPK